MEIKVLGCYGNQLLEKKTTSFILNKTIAIDAGAIASSLSLEEQIIIGDILITHSHLDHIKDLAFLGDNIINRRDNPVTIHASRKTINVLRNHYFNNDVWPDFTKIPTAENPVFEYKEIEEGKPFNINGIDIKPIKTSHTVHALSFIIKDHKNTIFHITDTGVTEDFWDQINEEDNLTAVFLETSFPNEYEKLARASKHLVPFDLENELAKINKREKDIDVFVYHLKPIYESKLRHQIAKVKVDGFNINIMEQGDNIKYV